MAWPVSLQIEDKTPFGRLYKPGEAPLPEDTEAAQMYKLASELLVDAGYEHYEVSSYALPGHRWELLPLLPCAGLALRDDMASVQNQTSMLLPGHAMIRGFQLTSCSKGQTACG